MRMNIPTLSPAISVIISVYNAEKYIGACLESILGQTFQNYEIVAVNNGSTDSSAKILESYAPKFGGRLKISRIEINSGNPSAAFNKGVNLSRGKYVYFIDSDDLIVNTALENLYQNAEKFDAEVVSMDRHFRFERNAHNPFPTANDVIISPSIGTPWLINEPTLETEDMGERIKKFCQTQYEYTLWRRLTRRDLLVENDILYPDLAIYGDLIYTLKVLYFAKKFLILPEPLYIYRANPDSVTMSRRTPEQDLEFRISTYVKGIECLDDFLSRQKFFQDNPTYWQMVLEIFEALQLNPAINTFLRLTPTESYAILRNKLEHYFEKHGALIAYLANSTSFWRLRWIVTNQRVVELEKQLKQIQGG